MSFIRESVIKVEGGQRETRTSDDNLQELSRNMLTQLKIIGMHMSIISNNNIKEEDVEDNE